MPIVKGSQRVIDINENWDVESMLTLENQSNHRLSHRPDDLNALLAHYLKINAIAEGVRDATRVNMALFQMPPTGGERGRRGGLCSYSAKEVLDYKRELGLLPVSPAQVVSYVADTRLQPGYLRGVIDVDNIVYRSEIGSGELNGEEPWKHFNWETEKLETVRNGTEFNNYLAWHGKYSSGTPIWRIENEGVPHRMMGDSKGVKPTGLPYVTPGGHFTQYDTFFVRVPDEEVVPDEETQAS